MKLTIRKIFVNDRKNNETGESFKNLSIYTQEYGDKALSGPINAVSEKWKEGDVVEVTVTENGKFLNFKPVYSPAQPMAHNNTSQEGYSDGPVSALDLLMSAQEKINQALEMLRNR